jgi:hypothetical protein
LFGFAIGYHPILRPIVHMLESLLQPPHVKPLMADSHECFNWGMDFKKERRPQIRGAEE